MHTLTIWLAAIRPKTLLAALSPVMVGGALAFAQGYRNLAVWIITAVTAMLLQAIANLANDFFDFKHGFDLPDRTGPLRVMQNGLVNPKTFAIVIFVFSVIAVLLGLILVWHGGWPILVTGAVSLAFAFLYSAGPWPLSCHALGEAASVFFFGLVATGGAFYLQTHSLNFTVLWLALTPGFLIACIMMVNNYRDMAIDRQTGKKTLAGFLGPKGALRLYVAAILGAYGVAVVAAVLLPAISLWALLALLSLPLAVKVIQGMYRKTGSALNQTLTQTALLTFCTSLLLSIGLML